MSSLARDLKTIAVRDRWAYEELTFDAKMKEWNILCGQVSERLAEPLHDEMAAAAVRMFHSLNGMYAYLCEVYGGGERVLSMLRWLVAVQGERRKTLYLD